MSDNELPTKLEAHRKATVAMQKRERERVKKMLKTLDGNVDAAIKVVHRYDVHFTVGW